MTSQLDMHPHGGRRKNNFLSLGIDIGGTSIKLGVVRISKLQTDILISTQWPTSSFRSIEEFLTALQENVDHVCREYGSISAVGIGFPSCVHWEEGTVSVPPNIPWWSVDHYPLRSKLHELLGIPVDVDNDANTAAYAEIRLGKGQQCPSFLYITLGTGVGGAIVINRELYRGHYGTAGEIGHIVIDARAPEIDPSYRTGVLESFVGRAGILNEIQRAMEHYPQSILHTITPFDVEHVAGAAHRGDVAAVEALTNAGRWFGIGLSSALNLMGIENVVVGGGMAALPEVFYHTTIDTIRHRVIPPLAPHVILTRSKLGNKAGVIGAALLGLSKAHSQ